jgi:hypothetical protein
MRTGTWITAVALTAGLTSGLRAGEEARLSETIDQHVTASPATPETAEWVAVRCAGLYAAIAKAFINETESQRKAMEGDFKAWYERFFTVAARIEFAKGAAKEPERLKREVLEVGNAYAEAMAAVRATQGSFMEAPIIRADLSACRVLEADSLPGAGP